MPMLLQVEWEGFVEAVDQWVGKRHAAISTLHGKTLLTAGCPNEGIIISSIVANDVDTVKRSLTEQGFKLVQGKWSTEHNPVSEHDSLAEIHVVAIAYKSREDMPGLWVDAFPFPPNQGEALKALYEHFEETGEIEGISFDQFIHAANPNVVIVSPEDIDRFARMKAIE